MDLGQFKSDVQKNEGGVWVQLDGDGKLLIARAGNALYLESLKKRMDAGRRKYSSLDAIPEQEQNEILNGALVDAVLLDWDGLTKDGNPFPYTKQNALKMLTDKAYFEFKELVIQISTDNARFRVEQLKEAEENIKK